MDGFNAPRRERPGRPLAGRAPGRVAIGLRPHPVRAAPARRPGHDDRGRCPIRPAGRPGTWPANWPPTPTTSGSRRPPKRPTAAWRGGCSSPASLSTRRGRRSRSSQGPDGFTVRAGEPRGRARRRRARRCRQRSTPGGPPGRSGPAPDPERAGMTLPGLQRLRGRRPERCTAPRPTATASRRSTTTSTSSRPRPRPRSTCWPSSPAARPGPRAGHRYRSPRPPPGRPRRHRARDRRVRRRWSRSCGPSPAGPEIDVTIGDFSDVPGDTPCRLVYVAFNTFFALLSQDDQLRCFDGWPSAWWRGAGSWWRPSSPT